MNRAVILIVDDEATNLRYVAQILSGDYTVKACRSGEDALRAVESTDLDLILLDVHMEHMDSFQVARILQSSPIPERYP
ncbi:MAG: response regulator [Spirochaetales bacterium]|nr:response regulator [Spirochaetales bacterium]